MRLPACLLVAVAASACQSTAFEMTDAQKAEVEASALAASRAWTEAYLAQENADDYMRFVSDWAIAPFSGANSTDATRATLEREWARTDWLTSEVRDEEVMVLGPDAAAVRFVTHGNVADTTGAVMVTTQNVAYVLHRVNGEWKALVARVSTTRQPLEEE